MPHPNPGITDEIQTINDTVGVMQSATALITGFSARLQAAVDAALDNGATSAELQPLLDLKSLLDSNKADLANAVAANS